jgi:hypothetical protein
MTFTLAVLGKDKMDILATLSAKVLSALSAEKYTNKPGILFPVIWCISNPDYVLMLCFVIASLF